MTKNQIKQKTCSRCGETKSITEFNKNKSKRDGYQSECKQCRHELDRKYYENKKKQSILVSNPFKSSSISRKSSITNSEINNTTATRISHYLANLKSIEDIDKEIMETEVRLSIMKYLRLKDLK